MLFVVFFLSQSAVFRLSGIAKVYIIVRVSVYLCERSTFYIADF